MDPISYGVANQALKQLSNIEHALGEDVQGNYESIKARIDALEIAMQTVVKEADKLIIQDAINIMKANAKFNVAVKAKRYQMQNMLFDDLLDDSGLDKVKSKNYVLDTEVGTITASDDCLVETGKLELPATPAKLILVVDQTSINTYYASRDGGTIWEAITPEQLFYFDDNISPLENKLKLKMKLSNGSKLLSYALTWV
jgi:hypothetical protein